MACHQRLGTAHTKERHRAWHDIITFGQHTRLNYVWRGKPSSPLGSTNGRTTSGVACHHHLWAAHTVERRQAWHAIIALRQHTQSKDVGRGMTSPPLDIKHGGTSFGVACHYRLWAAHTIERRRTWHAIITIGQHKRRMTSGVACHHRRWTSLHSQTASGVACHHHLRAAQTVERRREWHSIIVFGLPHIVGWC